MSNHENSIYLNERTKSEILIGEPASRKDGLAVALYKSPNGVAVKTGIVYAFYLDSEVAKLGNGNWDTGLIRLGRNAMVEPSPLAGSWRPFHEELSQTNTDTN
jgi:hypothetical protein